MSLRVTQCSPFVLPVALKSKSILSLINPAQKFGEVKKLVLLREVELDSSTEPPIRMGMELNVIN